MTPEQHRAKAARIERSLGRLGPEDAELRIEASMLAGTHWLNAVLHEDGITEPSADVMHTYMLVVNELRKLRLVRDGLIDALTEIEDIRPAWVRGISRVVTRRPSVRSHCWPACGPRRGRPGDLTRPARRADLPHSARAQTLATRSLPKLW